MSKHISYFSRDIHTSRYCQESVCLTEGPEIQNNPVFHSQWRRTLLEREKIGRPRIAEMYYSVPSTHDKYYRGQLFHHHGS
jgi:hypothetical protein